VLLWLLRLICDIFVSMQLTVFVNRAHRSTTPRLSLLCNIDVLSNSSLPASCDKTQTFQSPETGVACARGASLFHRVHVGD